MNNNALVPMRSVGPVKILYNDECLEVKVPLATYEIPLWPSTDRGARVTRAAGGIRGILVDYSMNRSIVVEANSAYEAVNIMASIKASQHEIEALIATTSRFARLKDLTFEVLGKLLYIRIGITPGDASGHNMVTKAAEAVLNFVLTKYTALSYVSISGNFCVDKKNSAINGILGRGKRVIAEVTIPRNICERQLRTTPEKIKELNIKKNWIGSNLAGGIRTANAHFANILLAFYLATGQDAANIVEGSQGMVYADVDSNGDLYFSVSIPNAIVGVVGNGKHLDFVKENLKSIECLRENEDVGANSNRLAVILAATVLCGELSLLAAQTNPGELVRSHIAIERAAH